MTVCTAAVYLELGHGPIRGYGMFTISDRMITDTGSWRTSEPAEDKVFPLTPRSRLLRAGDIPGDRPLWEAAMLSASLEESLAEIVDVYQEHYSAQRQRIAEREYLRPHGSTMETWAVGQQTMNASLVLSIAQRLEQGNLLNVESIICGFHTPQVLQGRLAQPHLYRIGDFGHVTVHDTVGMVAIGPGPMPSTRSSSWAATSGCGIGLVPCDCCFPRRSRPKRSQALAARLTCFEIAPTETNNRADWIAPLEAMYAHANEDAAQVWQRADAETRKMLDGPDE